MDLIDSLSWSLRAQYVYRLSVFRTDRNRSKVVSDKIEVGLSLAYFILVSAVVGVTFYESYFSPAENFFQIGKSEF
jgi:hypothetical protein